MVLQQKTEANLWGWAAPNEEVKVTLGDATTATKADSDGKWKTKIKTPAAGGPHELTFKGTNEITLKDVYVGEVWIASGQSNMLDANLVINQGRTQTPHSSSQRVRRGSRTERCLGKLRCCDFRLTRAKLLIIRHLCFVQPAETTRCLVGFVPNLSVR